MAILPQFNVDLMLADAYARGWNQKRLGLLADVSPVSLSRFLNRHTRSLQTAIKLADALGYPLSRYVLSPADPLPRPDAELVTSGTS